MSSSPSFSKKKILVLASTGFIIRNLVLGKFIDALPKNVEIFVAVPDPNDPVLKEIFESKGIKAIPFFKEYSEAQDSLKMILGWHNIYYRFKQGQKKTKSFTLQMKLWESSVSWKRRLAEQILITIGKFFTLINLFDWVEKQYLNYIRNRRTTKLWKDALINLQPELLLSTMLSHAYKRNCSIDLPAVIAANDLKIKTCTLIQSWDNLSSKIALLPPFLTKVFSWSESMNDEINQYYPSIRQEKIKITGGPQFDFHKDNLILEDRHIFCNTLNIDTNRPYIVIATGTETWMPDEPEKVIRLTEKLKTVMPELQVLIRLHPKDYGIRWNKFDGIIKELDLRLQYTHPNQHMDEGGFTPPIDFYKEQVNTLFHSAVVLNSSSTITVDAALIDKPVICIAYDLKYDTKFPEGRSFAFTQSNHYQKLIVTSGVRLAYSEQECIDLIKFCLNNPNEDKFGREKIVETVTQFSDGKAGIRLAEEISSLLGSSIILKISEFEDNTNKNFIYTK
ncbi:MAG: hypothetical protein IPJ74_09125 [Saprospiraceae bacterium]|nr:hypothetical protein [Saprospiraceae bacterium]